MLWVTVVWQNDAENSGMGALMRVTKVVEDDTQLWPMNSFKKSTDARVENVISRYQNFLKNFHKIWGLFCIKLSWTDWVTNEELRDGVNNRLHNLAALFFEEGLQKLVSRYNKCLNVDGNYVEK